MTRPLEREMGHHRKGVLLASALLLLAGCAREPSEADIKKAYDVKLSEINQSMRGAV